MAARQKGDYSPGTITAELIRQVAQWPAPKPPREIRDRTHGLILRHQPSGYLSLYATLGRGKRERLCAAADVTDPRHSTTMAKVRAWSRQLRGESAGGRDFAAERERSRGVPTLAEWLADEEGRYGWWLVANRKDGINTLARLNRLYLAPFGKHRLDEITPALLEAWRTKRLKQATRETVNRDVGALRSALTKAVEWELIDQHPLRAVRPLQVDRHRRAIRALSDDEVTALRAALDAREARMRADRDAGNAWREEREYELLPSLDGLYADALRPAVELSLETGMRKAECLGLRWEWVNMKGGNIALPGEATKSFLSRDVPLNENAKAVLRRWWLQHRRPREGYVFAHPDGAAIQNLKKAFNKVVEDASIPKATGSGRVSWHSLRHTFGSRLGAAGVDAETLRELMGHANLTTTQRYLQSAIDRKRAAVERLVNVS